VKRSEAKLAGAKTYHPGSACVQGHISGRWTSNGRCIECSKAGFREWHSQNAERGAEKSRRWRENNVETYLASARVRASLRYSEKREECLAYAKAYRGDDHRRVAGIERARDWAAANQEAVREHKRKNQAKRRARKHGAGGSFTLQDIQDLLQKQTGKCAYFEHCGHQFVGLKYHIDHIRPLARGGDNTRLNLQLLCAPCNIRKGARDPEVFAALIGIAA
jgi:5-methylcytosine-specific restriction endonuclease McrA